MPAKKVVKDETAGNFLLFLKSSIAFGCGGPESKEKFFQSVFESYIPLLQIFYELRSSNIQPKITMGLSPSVLRCLDAMNRSFEFDRYMSGRIEGAEADYSRNAAGQHKILQRLADFYVKNYKETQSFYFENIRRDILNAFKLLQKEGLIEIAAIPDSEYTSSALQSLVCLGEELKIYEEYFGARPGGVLFPGFGNGCGFTEFLDERSSGNTIDEIAASLGFRYLITGQKDIEKGRCFLLLKENDNYNNPNLNVSHASSYLPYKMSSGVAVLANNSQTEMQVTDKEWGYLVDANYRDHVKADQLSGLKYWGSPKNGGSRRFYDPFKAEPRIDENAFHFNKLVEELLTNFYMHNKEKGFILSLFDLETFGLRWLEGVRWIREAVVMMHNNPYVKQKTVSECLYCDPPKRHIEFSADMPR